MNGHAVETILPVRTTAAEYITLVKPGIIGLVLVAALTGIYLGGQGGGYNLSTILWTLGGLGTATAGSALLNNYFDRDIDRLMERTAARALALGKVSPNKALLTALVLIFFSITALAIEVNAATALLTATAACGYVFLYGVILKRRSPLANQIGGLAGALPPLIGYAAVTGGVDGTALILFAIVALWQQPHALSLALKYKDQYARAAIPVIPVAKGVYATKVRIFIYTIFLLPVSTLLFFAHITGTAYLGAAVALGLVYLVLAVKFLRSPRQYDMFLFFFSILYLTLLFTAMILNVA